jgi:glycyl-tRNA synthetase
VERIALALLLDAYREEQDPSAGSGQSKERIRVVLALSPQLAPVKVAVFPLLANKPGLVEKARKVYDGLRGKVEGLVVWDDIGNIGKRYRRQDEIGTPWCVTIDFDTLKDETVTVRDRDTMKQERLVAQELPPYFQSKL